LPTERDDAAPENVSVTTSREEFSTRLGHSVNMSVLFPAVNMSVIFPTGMECTRIWAVDVNGYGCELQCRVAQLFGCIAACGLAASPRNPPLPCCSGYRLFLPHRGAGEDVVVAHRIAITVTHQGRAVEDIPGTVQNHGGSRAVAGACPCQQPADSSCMQAGMPRATCSLATSRTLCPK
jgi:hypothetical protein